MAKLGFRVTGGEKAKFLKIFEKPGSHADIGLSQHWCFFVG
jgi:hypothetical protein